MEKSIENAFSYMLKDEKWYPKIGVLVLIYLVFWGAICFFVNEFISLIINHNMPPVFPSTEIGITIGIYAAIFILFSAIGVSLVTGFLARCTQKVVESDGKELISLPEWEKGFLYYYILGAKKSAAFNAVHVLLQPANILLGLATLFLGCIRPALNRIFCTEFKFGSYFAWQEAFDLITKNVGLYLLILLIEILLSLSLIGCLIIFFYAKVSYVIIALFATVFSVYISLVRAFMEGIIGEKKKKENDTIQS